MRRIVLSEDNFRLFSIGPGSLPSTNVMVTQPNKDSQTGPKKRPFTWLRDEKSIDFYASLRSACFISSNSSFHSGFCKFAPREHVFFTS